MEDAFSTQREDLLSTLRPLHTICDGHLGFMNETRRTLARRTAGITELYRVGTAQRRTEQTNVQNMLKEGVLEPKNSEWTFSTVMAPKKDGSIRFCVEFLRFNILIKWDP